MTFETHGTKPRTPGLANVFWGAGIQMPIYDAVQKKRIRRGWEVITVVLVVVAAVGLLVGLLTRSVGWAALAAVATYVATTVIAALVVHWLEARQPPAAEGN